jgi:hypothetical protein
MLRLANRDLMFIGNKKLHHIMYFASTVKLIPDPEICFFYISPDPLKISMPNQLMPFIKTIRHMIRQENF